MHFYGLSWSEYRDLPVDLHSALLKYREKVLKAQQQR